MNSPKTSNNLTKIPDSIDSRFSLSSPPPSPLIVVHDHPLTHISSLSADDKLERDTLNLYGDSSDPDFAALGVSSASKNGPVTLYLDDFTNPPSLSESSSKKSSSKKSSSTKSSSTKHPAKKSSAKKFTTKKSKAGSKKRKSKKTKKRRY